MLFIRRTARNVFIRSGRIDSLAEYIVDHFEGKIVTFEEGWKEVDEFQTLLFLTPAGLRKTRIEDAEKIIRVPVESSQILSELFSPEIHKMIENTQLGAGIIIVRVAGDGTALEKEMEEIYGAESMNIELAVSEGEANDTILLLTNTSLSRKLTEEDIIRVPLLIRQDHRTLYRDLRKQGAHLITQSLRDKKWYEMRINIYDAENHYEIHYERLQTAFSDLDIGMILGETWTRDHALVLMSVLAYQVRLFSLEPPEKIKRILMGLEFNSRGKRFVDMDLYYRNRKVGKNDKNVRKSINEPRVEIRDELINRLTPQAQQELQKLENIITGKE